MSIRVLRVEGEGPLERGPRGQRLPEFHVQRAQVVESDRARVELCHTLEGDQSRRVEALFGELEAVLEVAALPRRRIESSGEGNRPRQARGGRRIGRGDIFDDPRDGDWFAIDLDDLPLGADQKRRRQT